MKVQDYNRQITRSPPITTTSNIIDQTLIEMPYTRDPATALKKLPSLDQEEKIRTLTHSTPRKSSHTYLESSPRHHTIGRIHTPTSPQTILSPSHSMNADKNFEGANQDFEFIRSPSKPVTKLKRGPGNPIAELESIGKRNVDKKSDEDDRSISTANAAE